MKKIFLIVLLVIIFAVTVQADEEPSIILDEQFGSFDFDEINSVVDDSLDIDFESLVKDIVLGNVEISFVDILEYIVQSIFSEIYNNSKLMKSLIVICILSGIISTIATGLKDSSITQMGFFINYIMVANILFTGFYMCVDILSGSIAEILNIIRASLPLIIGILITGGNVASASMLNPLMLVAVELLSNVINTFLIPLITFSVILRILNALSEKEILSKMSDLFKLVAVWGLRCVAIVFMGLLSIQRVSAPILNDTINKTAKATVNMVPVVGDIFAGSLESAMYWIGALKNGLGIGVVIVIVLSCMVPIIKIIAVLAIYKITAAVIQPITDGRISEIIDCMGEYTGVILSALITVMVMFIISVLIMLCTIS